MGKLVRDGIPEIIRASGGHPKIRVLSFDEYRLALKEKLVEESEEALSATEVDLLEELADILEVVATLAGVYGYEMADVIAASEAKAESRGRFVSRIYLDE